MPTKTNGEQLHGALIGFGGVAANGHVPAFAADPRFLIDSVVEPDPARAALARATIPGVRLYDSLSSLFRAEQLDFVDVCTPNTLHANMVLSALHTGSHVLCEKPLAVTMSAVNEIRSASAVAGKVVFTVNNWHYAPLWSTAARLVRDGSIGVVRSVRLNVERPNASGGGVSQWRQCVVTAGGGILIDHGWHNLYIALSLLDGRRPVSVRATMTPKPDDAVAEQCVDLEILFDDAEAYLHLNSCAGGRRNHGLIEGDDGSVLIDDDHIVLSGKAMDPKEFRFGEALSRRSHHPDWMSGVLASFRLAMAEPAVGSTNLREAAQCTLLIHLAYESATHDCQLPIGPEFDEL